MRRKLIKIITSALLVIALMFSNTTGFTAYAETSITLPNTKLDDFTDWAVDGVRGVAGNTFYNSTLQPKDSNGWQAIRYGNSNAGYSARANGDNSFDLWKTSVVVQGAIIINARLSTEVSSPLPEGRYYELRYTFLNVSGDFSVSVAVYKGTNANLNNWNNNNVTYSVSYDGGAANSNASWTARSNGDHTARFNGNDEVVRIGFGFMHNTAGRHARVSNLELVDITPAAVPTVSGITEGAASIGGNTTAAPNDLRPSRQGDVVRITRISPNGTSLVLGTTTVQADNTWSYTLPSAAVVGEQYTAVITNDVSGLTSTPASTTVVVNETNRTLAIEAVNDKATELTSRINQLVNVPQSEKDAAIAAIETERAKAVEAINAGTSTPAFNNERDQGIAAMQDIYNELRLSDTKYLDNAKAVGKANLNEKAQAAKDAIDALEHLSPTEKEEAKAAIDTRLQEAETAIDTATTMSGVNGIVTGKTTEMDQVVSDARLQDAINEAVRAVEEKAADVKERLAQIADIPSSELEEANDKVDVELSRIIDAIRGSTDIADANSNRDDGKAELEGIYDAYKDKGATRLEANKTASKDTLESDRAAALAYIDTLPHLTSEDVSDYQNQINEAYDAGLSALDDAGSLDDMNGIQEDTRETYEDIKGAADVKNAQNDAVAQLNEKADAVNAAIDALSNVSEADRSAAKQAVVDERDEAISAVNNETSVQGVDDARMHGFNEMDRIYDALEGDDQELLASAKTNRKNDLEAKAQAAREAVNAMNPLSSAAKADYIEEINSELAAGQQAIDNQTTVEGVNTAARDAAQGMEETVEAASLDNDKLKALDALNQKADTIRQRIAATPGATEEDKTAALQEVNDIVGEATAAIQDAASSAGVSTQLDAGRSRLDGVTAALAQTGQDNLNDARDQVSTDLDDKAQEAITKVNGNLNLSEDEKAGFIAEIEAARDVAKGNLSSAPDFASITAIETDAQETFDAIVDRAWKQDAKNVIDQEADTVKAKIEALDDLDETSKEAAIAEAQRIRNEGVDAVDKSTTEPSIRIAKVYTIDELDKVLADAEIASTRLEAIRHLEETAASVKERINALPGLTVQEKQALNDEVDDLLGEAIGNVNNGINATEIFNAQDGGQKAMEAVYDRAGSQSESHLVDATQASLERIQYEAQKAKDAIDALDRLSDEEKAEYKERIDEALQSGTNAIHNAATLDDIQAAEDATIAEYESIGAEARERNDFLKAQADGKQTVEDQGDAAKDAIDAMDSLSDEEKQAAKEAIDRIVEAAKNDIDTAATSDEVTTIVDEALQDIAEVADQAQAEENKKQIIQELEEKASSAKDEIEAMDHLSDEEKQSAKEAIDQELGNAREAIADGEDPQRVQENSEQRIDAIVADATLRNEKNKAREQVREFADKAIETLRESTLSDAQKNELITKIENIVTEGLAAIEASQSMREVNEALDAARNAINALLSVNGLPSTGVSDSLHSYAIMMAVAGLGCILISKRRRKLNES